MASKRLYALSAKRIMVKTIKLYDLIAKLRAQASLLYDMSDGHPENTIEPLIKIRDNAIDQSSVSELVMAIKSLEDCNNGHKDTMKFLHEKIDNNQEYIEMIKKQIIKRMNNNGTNVLLENDFTISLVDNEIKIR